MKVEITKIGQESYDVISARWYSALACQACN